MNKNYDFSKYKVSIKETSYDDAQNEYMTESQIEVIDFDKVKEEYICTLKLSEPPKSCDSLYMNGDEKIFIEFKNGKVKPFEVRKKIYDSILIFSDLIKCGISETRAEIEYILVYNHEANKNNKDYNFDPKTNIQESDEYDLLSKIISENAKEHILKFKLNDFKNYLVKNIYTYNKEEFEDKFIKKRQL